MRIAISNFDPLWFTKAPHALALKATRASHYDPVALQAMGSGGVFAIPGFDDEVDSVVRLMTTKGPGQINKATARLKLKNFLKDQRYVPQEPGSVSDLSTDTRLDLILETQARMSRGLRQYEQDTTRLAKSMYPCWEFARVEQRKEPRPWPEVWEEHGGQFFPGAGSYPEGRMIARKDSTIWTAINYFGNSYPPFAFNSGMGLRGVARDECVRFKLIRADEFTQYKEAA